MEKVAIIYTTFLRDSLMMKTVKSIMDNCQDNYALLIGDQNKVSETFAMKDLVIGFYCTPDYYHNNTSISSKDVYHYRLPFDCGLSASRNHLVQKAHEMGIKYVLISADSIAFTDKYNFEPIIDFIKTRNNNAIVGLKLANRQPFEYDMSIDREYGKFILDKPSRGKITSTLGNTIIHYQRCDIVKNFFIAPTELLIKFPWRNELKLAEHETEFLQFKQNNVEVYYTEKIGADYIDEKPDEYKKARNRLYSEFVKKMREINGMVDNRGGWLEYKWRSF